MERVFIDPDGVWEAATKYDQLADDLDQRAAAIAEILEEACETSTAPAKARRSAALFREMAAEMRQRVETIRQADTGGWGDAFRDLFTTSGFTWESALWTERGAELAQRLNHIGKLDQMAGREFHAVAGELARNQGHPAYAAAFYGALDPNLAEALPAQLAATGTDTARADLESFSRAFGAAVSHPDPSATLARIAERFTETPDFTGQAWNRGALLAYGDFPPEWLSRVARVNILDDLAAHLDDDLRAGGPEAHALGLPEDALALYLGALGHNPAAARDALTQMGGPDHHRSLQDNIGRILAYSRVVGTGDTVAEGLGQALEAATGATDEAMGAHSPQAAHFAFDTITTLADQREVPWAMKDSLGQIAAAYAPEITIGASLGDAQFRSSAFAVPDHLTPIVGLAPSFYLSTEDTYRYLKTFADDSTFADPFDHAMGTLQAQILPQAARADLDAIRAPGLDPRHYREAAYALGNVAGLEYEAQRVVRGAMDESDREARKLIATTLTLGVNKAIGVVAPEASAAARAGWALTKFAAKHGIQKMTDDPEPTRVDQVEATYDQMVLGATYNIAGILMRAGWPAAVPPPASILHPDGTLKTYPEIAADGKTMREFSDWIDSTDTDAGSLDKKVEDGAQGLSSGSNDGGANARAIEKNHGPKM